MTSNDIYISLIHSYKWQMLRKRVLTAHPLCQRCEAEGRTQCATEVHHVTPVESGVNIREQKSLCYDVHNLRALCHECHLTAHKELGRSGKAARARINQEQKTRIINRFFGGGG